jgi:hypothetical protein
MRQINFDVYTSIWCRWCRDWSMYIRWGQYLCEQLDVDDTMVPGLWAAPNVREANEIFWDHFRAD